MAVVFEYLTARYFDSGGRGNESEAIDTIGTYGLALRLPRFRLTEDTFIHKLQLLSVWFLLLAL